MYFKLVECNGLSRYIFAKNEINHTNQMVDERTKFVGN